MAASSSWKLLPGDPCRVILTSDSEPLRIRPVHAADKKRTRAGLAGLSREERIHRFFTPIQDLNEAMLRFLTEVDQWNHVAWGAVLDQDAEPAVGVARWIRIPDRPDHAELAVAVAADWRRRGLGRLLLRVMATLAMVREVNVFELKVLSDHLEGLAFFRRLGAVDVRYEAGVIHLEWDREAWDSNDELAQVREWLGPKLWLDHRRETS